MVVRSGTYQSSIPARGKRFKHSEVPAALISEVSCKSLLAPSRFGEWATQIYMPINFTIGAPGQQPQSMRFLMNMDLARTPGGWKVSSILPIPEPVQ
jgi:hypothetical protein